MISISESTFLFNNGSLQGPGHTLFAIDDRLIDVHNSTFLHNTGQYYGVFGAVLNYISAVSDSEGSLLPLKAFYK